MKNIHLIQTDKPSRLVRFFTNKYHLCKEILPIQDEERYVNIYIISSDEEIKEGDFYLHISNDINGIEYTTINTCHKPHRKQDNEWYVDGMYSNQCKKIILTTDQDLDGVQAIDDEFLQWFVKNPSCEEVEVIKEYFWEDTFRGYSLRLPKEQQKQHLIDIMKSDEELGLYEEPKQETLEEFIKSIYPSPSGAKIKGIELGAKWQQQNSYSEEEIKQAFKVGFSIGYGSDVHAIDEKNRTCEEWFNKFKKK